VSINAGAASSPNARPPIGDTLALRGQVAETLKAGRYSVTSTGVGRPACGPSRETPECADTRVEAGDPEASSSGDRCWGVPAIQDRLSGVLEYGDRKPGIAEREGIAVNRETSGD